jgi:hypothetical protein
MSGSALAVKGPDRLPGVAKKPSLRIPAVIKNNRWFYILIVGAR